MNILKRGLAISIATAMTLTPAITIAEKLEVVPISAPVVISEVEQEKEANYIEFSGKITEVNKDGKNTFILVANDNKDGFNELRVVLGDSVLLSDKTMDLAQEDLLKKDVKVSVFYNKNTPMTLSLPPMISPDAIVIKETEEPTSVMVDKFDDKLLNEKGDLYLLVSEKTNIIDVEGNKMTKADLANRDLVVFYSIVLESYPGQTNPDKVIVLPIKEEIEEETPVEVKEVILNKQLVSINDKGVTMIPLRYVAEELGYEVKWNGETKSVEITKGPQWSLVTIGEDNYNFAKMRIKMGTAPIIINGSTFVPLNFAEEVLMSTIEIMENGFIKITNN